MFPAIPIRDYYAQEENFIASYKILSAELKMQILGTPKDFIYPDEFVYDTGYHLNRIGREKRTEHMIELLDTVLQK